MQSGCLQAGGPHDWVMRLGNVLGCALIELGPTARGLHVVGLRAWATKLGFVSALIHWAGPCCLGASRLEQPIWDPSVKTVVID